MLVVPYSAASHHAIGAAELALMKPSATLTNIARGGIVDDAALAVALRERRIAAAGLDVFEGEPRVHPDLLTVPNVVLTPHIASATVATRLGMAEPRRRQPDRGADRGGTADPDQPAGAAAQAFLSSAVSIGSVRMRLPVAAKIALVTAGAIGGVPGSPMPPGCLAARHDVHLDLGHLAHAQHRVVVEVALLDAAVLEGDLAVQRRRQAVDDRALDLARDDLAG